jgi:Leucine-rich repeat (LRR) protein
MHRFVVSFVCCMSVGAGFGEDSTTVDLTGRDADIVERVVKKNRSIQSLDLPDSGANSKTLRLLEENRLLLSLNVSGCSKLVSEDFDIIGKMVQLRHLNLGATCIDERNYPSICKLRNLKSLDIGCTAIQSFSPLLDHLPQLEGLILAATSVTDKAFNSIPPRHRLKELDLSDTAITDAAIASLVRLSNLRILKLSNTRITDKGLRLLQQLRHLEELDLSGTTIGDEGMEGVYDLRSLKRLNLEGTKVSSRSVCQLNLPQLTSLNLLQTSVGDKGIKALCQRSRKLFELAIGGQCTDLSLSYISRLPALVRLVVDNDSAAETPTVTANGIRALQANPKLADIDYRLYEGISDALFIELTKLPNLTNLRLTYAPLRLSSMLTLRNLEKLEGISLWLDSVSETHLLSALASCPNLKVVSLTGSVNARELALVLNCRSINRLYLTGSHADDRCVALLEQHMKHLKVLDLSFTKITGKSSKKLTQLKELQDLVLFGVQLSNEDVSAIRKSLPHCRVHFFPLAELVPELTNELGPVH